MIGPFGLAVRLWVVCHADVLFDVQVFAEFLHCSGSESGVLVRYHFLGEAVVWKNVFAVEFGDSYGVNCFLAQDKYGSL